MSSDIDAPAYPDILMVADVAQERFESAAATWAPDDATVQTYREHGRSGRSLPVQHVERILAVGQEVAAGAEADTGEEAHVVHIEGVRHDQVRVPRDHNVVRKVVSVRIGIVKEASVFDN